MKYTDKFFLFVLVGLLVIPSTVLVSAKRVLGSCGSFNCFLNTGTQNYGAGAGLFTVDLSYRYLLMDRGQRGSQKIDQVFTPKVNFEEAVLEPNHHREMKTINNLAQLNLMYGATQYFSLQLVVPFFNQRIHEHFDAVSASNPDGVFERGDGTDDFGDVRIIGRYNLLTTTKHLLVGGAGIKLPTGGEWVNLTPGIRVHASADTQLYAFGQIPVYQRVNESNLVPSFGLIFGISKTFGLSN